MEFREIEWKRVFTWLRMGTDSGVLLLRGPQNEENFLIAWMYLRRTLFHTVT
jgi:hypothetical protein